MNVFKRLVAPMAALTLGLVAPPPRERATAPREL